jgi:glycosyltransferase involved in cell wall biosynthesis
VTPPEVSLIMPAWRPRADWLVEAVSSALDERTAEIELIVVDDGSEEPVAPLLADVDDPRLQVIRVEHAGPYAARNAGIAQAHGSYLRFVDSDDIVEPGSTGRLLTLARIGGDAIAYGATLMCDENLEPERVISSDLEGWVAEDCVLGAFHVQVVAILFPRAVVDQAGPWEEQAFAVAGDWDFTLRALDQGPVRRLDEIVTRYRRHGRSVTKTADVAAGGATGRLVIERYFARHPEQHGTPLERRAYARLHLDRARAHAWVGERRAAARELAAVARRDPAAAVAAAARWGAGRVRALSRRVARRAARAPRSRA